MSVTVAGLVVAICAVSVLGFATTSLAAGCEQSDIHVTPVGGGISFPINVRRSTGNVPFMKAAYRRGAGDWLDDSLNWASFGDEYNGEFPIQDKSKFAAIPNKEFLVRFYGYYSDGGTPRGFHIIKNCTATQTQLNYYNDYDHYPNVVITITWDKPYAAPDVFGLQLPSSSAVPKQAPFGAKQ